MKSTIFGTKYLKTLWLRDAKIHLMNLNLTRKMKKMIIWGLYALNNSGKGGEDERGQLLVGGWNNKQTSDVSDKLVKNIYIFFNFLVYFRPVHQTLFAQKNYGNQCTIYFLCFAFNRWFWRDVSEGPSSCIDKGTLCCVRHTLREPHAQIRNMIYNIRVA